MATAFKDMIILVLLCKAITWGLLIFLVVFFMFTLASC